MRAADNGHALAVKALLEGGADTGKVDKVRTVVGRPWVVMVSRHFVLDP
jgi:hypothetical protein